MIRATALALVLATVPASAQTRPTVAIIDGALQYQPAILRPLSLSGIRGKLERLGYRVVTSTHFGEGLVGEEPVLLVAHSAGGARAHCFAKEQVEQAKFHPVVITLDAAPWWCDHIYQCPVEFCINIKTLGYPNIRGARNIPAQTSHVGLPFDEVVQGLVVKYAAPLARAR